VVETGHVAKADGVGRREQAEPGIGPDHAILIEQGELALRLEYPLDHEHHVGAAGVIFVEDERDRVLQRPWQEAFAELGHLLTFAQDDRVAADEVDTADVRVEIDADHRPIQSRRDLLDMC